MVIKELLVKLGLDLDSATFAEGKVAGEILTAAWSKGVEMLVNLGHEFEQQLHQTIQYGDQMFKLAQKTGIGQEALEGLAYAGQLADVSAESLATSVGILSKQMLAAKNGGEGATEALAGLSLKDEQGNLRSANDVMEQVADKFAEMPDGAQKTALAMKYFGRSGKDLIPLLNKGSEELKKMNEEAREFGLIVGPEAGKASEEIEDNFKRLKMITQGLWRQAIAPLLPAINDVLERFVKWRKENSEWMKTAIHRSVKALIWVVKALGEGLDFVVRNATMLKVVLGVAGLIGAINAFSSAAVIAGLKTSAAWLVAAAPFIAIGAAIMALLILFDDLRGYAAGEKSLIGEFEQDILKWLEPKAGDFWLTKLIKEFIDAVADAIDMVMNFDQKFFESRLWKRLEKEGDVLITPFKGVAKAFAGAPAAARGAMEVGEDTLVERQESIRQKSEAAAWNAQYNTPPMLATSSTSSSATTNNNRVQANITINQQPNQSGQDLSRQITEQLGSLFQETLPAVK